MKNFIIYYNSKIWNQCKNVYRNYKTLIANIPLKQLVCYMNSSLKHVANTKDGLTIACTIMAH